MRKASIKELFYERVKNMNDNSESELNYQGDIILVSKMSEFYPDTCWNDNVISDQDIENAIKNAILEQNSAFGGLDNWSEIEEKSNEWHIGRIVYFSNHPEEIKDIQIDNACEGMYISPIPIIIDGNHRFVAAKYLQLEKVHCRYGGREDVLDYLTGASDKIPVE